MKKKTLTWRKNAMVHQCFDALTQGTDLGMAPAAIPRTVDPAQKTPLYKGTANVKAKFLILFKFQ